MSKRYGRNQKRAARARVAELLAHLAATNELLKRNRASTLQLEQAANQIIAAHHEYSALIPVMPGRPEVRRIISMRLPHLSLDYRPSQHIAPLVMDEQITILNELRSVIDFDRMREEFSVHMLINGRPEWSYRFSGTMFGRGLPPTARRDIAEAMVGQLLHYVDEKWPAAIRRGLDQPRGF